jgi:hypothetical protein
MCTPSIKKGLDKMAGLRTAECLRRSHVPFFEALDGDKLQMLAETCKVRQFDVGRTVIRQGDIGETFYCIMYGTCSVHVKDVDDFGEVKEEKALVATLGEVPAISTAHRYMKGLTYIYV